MKLLSAGSLGCFVASNERFSVLKGVRGLDPDRSLDVFRDLLRPFPPFMFVWVVRGLDCSTADDPVPSGVRPSLAQVRHVSFEGGTLLRSPRLREDFASQGRG